MTDDEFAAELARVRADPRLVAFAAAAPRELSPGEATAIARLLWPRGAVHAKAPVSAG
jgi:hypothetical protein